MQIQWTTTNDLGEKVTENHPYLTMDNISSYAKHNHKSCNGTGVEFWDNGWEYVFDLDKKVYVRKPINPRVLACDCVMRTIERTGL